MKLLVLSPSTINTEPIIDSIPDSIDKRVVRFDIGDTNQIISEASTKPYNQPYDLVVYFSVSAGAHLPSIETLRKLNNVIHVCFDASCHDWVPLLNEYHEQKLFIKTINIDGNRNYPHSDVTTLCPISQKFYKPTNYGTFQSRHIHCGFGGGDGSSDRRQLIDHLGNHLIKMPRNESYGTYKYYADFMQSCKIVINMCKSGSGASTQVKARVIEAGMAHCLLLEEKGSVTDQWFVPGEDYLEYESKEHALEIIEGLYDNDASIFTYAENLHRKIMIDYSAETFWKKLLA